MQMSSFTFGCVNSDRQTGSAELGGPPPTTRTKTTAWRRADCVPTNAATRAERCPGRAAMMAIPFAVAEFNAVH
jgi:hypothetical protein